MGKMIDMIGKKYGRLTVISRGKNSNEGKPRFICKCECGNTSLVYGKLLRSGKTQSCGCLRYERLRQSITKHGLCFTKTYSVWNGIKDRCENPESFSYKYYGGRGIKLCDRWKDFEMFLADMGHKPKNKSIDRIDVNGHYSPENCRWATTIEQANNKRSNVLITHLGVTQTISNWARQLGIPRTTLYLRYLKNQTPEQILKPKNFPETVLFMGKKMTYPQIAKAVGMSYVTLRWRIRKGIPISEAATLTKGQNHGQRTIPKT